MPVGDGDAAQHGTDDAQIALVGAAELEALDEGQLAAEDLMRRAVDRAVDVSGEALEGVGGKGIEVQQLRSFGLGGGMEEVEDFFCFFEQGMGLLPLGSGIGLGAFVGQDCLPAVRIGQLGNAQNALRQAAVEAVAVVVGQAEEAGRGPDQTRGLAVVEALLLLEEDDGVVPAELTGLLLQNGDGLAEGELSGGGPGLVSAAAEPHGLDVADAGKDVLGLQVRAVLQHEAADLLLPNVDALDGAAHPPFPAQFPEALGQEAQDAPDAFEGPSEALQEDRAEEDGKAGPVDIVLPGAAVEEDRQQ